MLGLQKMEKFLFTSFLLAVVFAFVTSVPCDVMEALSGCSNSCSTGTEEVPDRGYCEANNGKRRCCRTTCAGPGTLCIGNSKSCEGTGEGYDEVDGTCPNDDEFRCCAPRGAGSGAPLPPPYPAPQPPAYPVYTTTPPPPAPVYQTTPPPPPAPQPETTQAPAPTAAPPQPEKPQPTEAPQQPPQEPVTAPPQPDPNQIPPDQKQPKKQGKHEKKNKKKTHQKKSKKAKKGKVGKKGKKKSQL